MSNSFLGNAINMKREQFYIQIKQRSRKAIMEKIRYQCMQHELDEFMDLLDAGKVTFTSTQMDMLFQLINKNNTNAIIHLGNLAIDGIIGPMHMREGQFRFVDNQYFQWMVWVLLQYGFQIPLSVFIEMIAKVLHLQDHENRKLNVLKCVNLIMKNQDSNFYSQFFMSCQDPTFVLNQLLFQCTSKDIRIKKEGWRVLSKIFSIDSDHIILTILTLIQIPIIHQIVMEGLLSVSALIRALSVQVLNNVIGYILELNCNRMEDQLGKTMNTILVLYGSGTQKKSVKVEISYLLQTLVLMANFDDFRWLLKIGMDKLCFEAKRKIQNIQIQQNECGLEMLLLQKMREMEETEGFSIYGINLREMEEQL